MFEGLVRQLILGYLGRYIKDIQKEQLKITLWNEEVLLENVELILEAFDYLRLPFAFKQGRVGKLSIKIPWKKLGWDPIIIILEDAYISVCPRDDTEWCKNAVERRELASKKARLAAAELAKLSRRVCENQTGRSFVSYITAKILDSIQVSVRNVHVLYCDTLNAPAETVFGLRLSSLTIMKQTPVASFVSRVRGGQVNKLIEVQGLELYCNSIRKKDDSNTEHIVDIRDMEREKSGDGNHSSLLAPLDVSASLSVTRSGKLLNDTPQYTVNIQMATVASSINEIQLRHILSLCDYMDICRLREKYGRYRPWWCPLEKKLKGWQKTWWHYAQASVLSDVRRRIWRTSWKFLGERLKSRRKYVNLYKAKLRCLRSDQVIDKGILHELEEVEKETDVDDILNYRSIAERELEDFLGKPSFRHGSMGSGGNLDKSVEDDRPAKPRGWLNWLSYGMLGAAGTDDSNQFSGVISEDVIKDIYEATEFHQDSVLYGDPGVMDEVYVSSMKINIAEVRATLWSMELERAIADLTLSGISAEGKVREKSAIITVSVNSAKILNPFSSQFVLSTKKVISEDVLIVKQQPSINIKVDYSPSSSNVSASVKVVFNSAEVFLEAEFLTNLIEFLSVLQRFNSQQQRIFSSLNGIDDVNSRLLSKINYALASRKKTMWAIILSNIVVCLPCGDANFQSHNLVVEAAEISFISRSEVDSAVSNGENLSLNGSVDFDCGSSMDVKTGVQIQNLYDHFEIQISDAQMKILMPSSIIPVSEKFSATASLVSCVLLNEPSLKEMEVHVCVPSLIVNFSASIYGEILGLAKRFHLLLPSSYPTTSPEKSNGSKISIGSWFSMDVSLNAIRVIVDLEDSVDDDCILKLDSQKLTIWFDQRDFTESWAAAQECKLTANSTINNWDDQIIFSLGSSLGSESIIQPATGVDCGVNSVSDGGIIMHFEADIRNQLFPLRCSISSNTSEIHCYPILVGKLVGFFGKLALSEKSAAKERKLVVHDEDSSRDNNGYQQFSPLKEAYSYKSSINSSDSITFDHLFSIGQMRLKLRKALELRRHKTDSKFSLVEGQGAFSAPFVNCITDAYSLIRTHGKGSSLINLSLECTTLHFHDSSCIVGTVVVPMARTSITVSEESMDMICLTEGASFSSSWWSQIVGEFLWGPLSADLSPTLNLHLKRRDAGLRTSQLHLSFHVQHVSCMLPPDFLALLVGYFSLPLWSPLEKEPANANAVSEGPDLITYQFNIADCNVLSPANSDFSEFLKIDIRNLCVSFSENDDISATEIPSLCCLDADKFCNRNDSLDFFGGDLSLSLLLLETCGVSAMSNCKNFVMIQALRADVWVRIPYTSYSDTASHPVCIMAMVSDCQFDIEEAWLVSGFNALVYVFDQFSWVGEASRIFTYDVPHFIQAKKQVMEDGAILPTTAVFCELRFSVKSLSIRLHQVREQSSVSELVAEADMHFICSASVISDKLERLDISFSSLALFSLLNSVVLAEFCRTASGSSVLDLVFAAPIHGDERIVISFPCVDVWLHLFDWNAVIDLLTSGFEQLSTLMTDASSESVHSVLIADNKDGVVSSPSRVAAVTNTPGTGFSILTLDNVGLTVHFPAIFSRDSDFTIGNFCNELSSDDMQSMNQNCFLSVSMWSINSVFVSNGKTVKLTINCKDMRGMLKLFSEEFSQSWPLFQLSKIYLEFEMSTIETQTTPMKCLVRCDSLDLSVSDHVFHPLHFKWFERSESTSPINRMEIQMQLRKFSLLLTDWKWTSNGPLLECVLRNTDFWCSVAEDEHDGIIKCDLQVNYYNIDKVLWEPLLEPWQFQLNVSRKNEQGALDSDSVATNISLGSDRPLNLNVNESIIEVVSRVNEMLEDAWEIISRTENSAIPISQITEGPEATRYAPYMIQNLTTLPLLFSVCKLKPDTDDPDVSPSNGVLPVGSSTLIYINEPSEDLLFRYRPLQSSDRLNEKQLLEAAHRYVRFQLEGASSPSAPISMDLVGRRYFEVEFSKSSQDFDAYSDDNDTTGNRKVETVNGTDVTVGFATPVVVDVSVQRFTKLIRLYSTVVVLNASSVSLEVRFDIPFGLSPKILGPIYPGQEFPLPLHLAEVGYIRWRPVGDSYLWSEAHNISTIITQDVRNGFLRSLVCYPSQPSSEAFRCCLSVNNQCLPPVSRARRVTSSRDFFNVKQPQNFHNLTSNDMEIPNNRFLYQLILSSPLLLKNYLMKPISMTLEDGGVRRIALLSEVETSFYHIDSSHDLLITFEIDGFRPSALKYPRSESFSTKAKFSGTKFSLTEIIRFDSNSANGPLYITMEKVMDAISGAREIIISVPFLLYNCTGFPLVLSNSADEMKGYSFLMPSCYNLDEKNVPVQKKFGLGIICSNQDLSVPATDLTAEAPSNSPDFAESGSRKVNPCLFSPDTRSYSGEIVVSISRYLPSVVKNVTKHLWSAPFSLVPPTGSTSILVPQPSMTSGYAVSVSAVAAPFSGRTKIITFQPRYVIANACSKNLRYKQKGTDVSFLLRAKKHSYVRWMDTTRELQLSVCLDEPGWEWSGCFVPEQLGDTQIKMHNHMTADICIMRVEVRIADVSVAEEKIVGSTSGNSGTNLILLSDDDTGFMPYRIDNHSRERLRVYQPKCESFQTIIHPYTSSPYAWDEPCNSHRLIIEIPGERILGSYAIDDVSTHSLVQLPATSEKRERNLLVSVHSEGATKVLSVIDSRYHVMSDLKGLRISQLKDKQKQNHSCKSFDSYKEKLSIEIPFFGVSLMNSHAEELLFACAKKLRVDFVQSMDQQQLSLQIAQVQIDNQLRTTTYPVILSFNHKPKSSQMMLKDNNSIEVLGGSASRVASSSMHEPVLSLAVVKWRTPDASLISFESISLRIADIYLEIEQDIVLRLFEFGKTASSRLQSRLSGHLSSIQSISVYDSDIALGNSRGARSSAGINDKFPYYTSSSMTNENRTENRLWPYMVPIGAPWQEIQLSSQKEKKIYVELFDIGPIKLTLSFSSSPWILKNGVLTSGESLIHRGLMALADVEGANIRFRQLVRSHQIASWESIQEIIVSHYSRQFFHEMYKVFGSAGVIGNPVGFARTLGLGIKEFFSLPVWSVFQSPTGLVTGMAQGTTSLLSNTVYAISDATSQFSKAAHKGIVAFTFDDQTMKVIERPQEGMPSHSKGVINEFLEGLTGVLQSPIRGAEKHGLPGVLSGIALGVTGLVARPAASILEVTGKTAQSIRNRSRIYHIGNRCFRVRLPRPLTSESPLRPYSWEEAIGSYVLTETDINTRNETLVTCKALKQSGQYVLLTAGLILVVSCSSLVNLNEPDFEGIPADLKWSIESEIGVDSVILADTDGEVAHIVGSGSDASFRQKLQHRNTENEMKGKVWSSFHSPLPLLQTNMEFSSREEASEFLRVLNVMIQRGKERGWDSVHVLQRSHIR